MKELRLDVNEMVRVVVCGRIFCMGFISKVEFLEPPPPEIVNGVELLKEFGDIQVTIKVQKEDLGCDPSVTVTSAS